MPFRDGGVGSDLARVGTKTGPRGASMGVSGDDSGAEIAQEATHAHSTNLRGYGVGSNVTDLEGDSVADAPTRRRLSLTKKQIEAGPGVELLSLLQTVTADGHLLDDEVLALREWLDQNRQADLPSIQYLTGTVMKILADGVVTDDERSELFDAIEKVLPPEIRKSTRIRREAIAYVEAVESPLSIDGSRPIETYDFMVAGVSYEGRPNVIRRHAKAGDPVYLSRDRTNRYSRNAVAVMVAGGHQIGFVPETDAVDLAPRLDEGCKYEASIKKILAARRGPLPVVVVDVYPPDSLVEGLRVETESPRVFARSAGSEGIRISWLPLIAALAGLVLAAIALERWF